VSEYQYYEFRAVDRALTDRQMRELRAISSRAEISRPSFSNYYTYGDLRANPRDLLTKYFDASLYFANWLFLEVAFRYPKGAVDVKALRRYAAGHTLEIRSTASDVIVALSVESDGESFDPADDGSGWLSSVIGLRADLASGDERFVYLAWLLDVQCGEIDDNAVEPARPEGLGNLSPVLDSLVDIIGLDRDLVAAAAGGSRQAVPRSSARDIDRWLATLDPAEHITMLSRIAGGNGDVGAELMRRFRQTHAVARQPCHCARSGSCVLRRKRSQRDDARLLGSVRPANARRGNARKGPRVFGT
jgi:hypothetical protein